MGQKHPLEEYGYYYINKLIEEIDDILIQKSDSYQKDIINKLVSFFMSEGYIFLSLTEKGETDYLFLIHILNKLQLIEKDFFLKIFFPLLEELKKSKFENQINFLERLKNEKVRDEYIKKIIKEKYFIKEYLKSTFQNNSEIQALDIFNFYTIFIVGLLFLFNKDKLKETKIDPISNPTYLYEYFYNIEPLNDLENIRQFILFLLLYSINDKKIKSLNQMMDDKENKKMNDKLGEKLINLNYKKFYFFLFKKSLNNNKIEVIITEGKKIEKKKLSINFFESIYNNKNNNDAIVYQSIFNEEKILILNNVDKKSLKKMIKEISNIYPSINEFNSYSLKDDIIININEFISLNPEITSELPQDAIPNKEKYNKQNELKTDNQNEKLNIKKSNIIQQDEISTKEFKQQINNNYKNNNIKNDKFINKDEKNEENPYKNKEDKKIKINFEDNKIIINELKDEINKLKKENKELKNENENFVKNIQFLNNELDNEKNKNKNLLKTIDNLKNELNKEKIKYIDLEEKMKIKENENKKLEKTSTRILYEKNNFEKEIETLKNKIKKYPFDLNDGEELISIIITTSDENIQHSIICKNTDLFYNIEKEFYKVYSEYSKTYNTFYIKGNKINKRKSLKDNKINNNDVVILNKII